MRANIASAGVAVTYHRPMTERLFVQLDDDAAGPDTTAPAGTMRAFPVAAPLRNHIASLLHYRETFAAGRETVERVLPDGAVRLVFNLGDAPAANDGQGLAVEAIGASTMPALVRLRGHVEGYSVALRPGAAAALLGMPAGEIAGSAVSLVDVWGSAGAELLARLADAHDDASRAALLADAFAHRLSRVKDPLHPAAAQAARLIAASGGCRALRDVAAAVNVGERRLQQIFHAHVGLSPRAWSRLARLHACLRALRAQASPRWADVAADAGYYDQAHLANEFRALCGLTPSEYFGRASGSSNTAA